MSTVIKVENISKQYRLGQVSTGTLSHDVNRWWHKLRGKENPYLKIGEANDCTKAGDSDYVWALQDINFEVKQGEVLGIIGRNGAGKSTLLKILSRTTAPTTGSIKIKGRVASLLEVGTGFHPELSGRDNIFLNGAILGMSKQEIKSKFDEIVDFAGVERYIDTPVKRYSSGMYIRLAFAVAAHLEPDILIVDEVLAVGDAEFQKKALGKMKDVSVKEGRTVLFVSHNMHSMLQLCQKGIFLGNGTISEMGSISKCVDIYLSKGIAYEAELNNAGQTDKPIITKVRIDKESLDKGEIEAIFEFKSPFIINSPSIGFVLSDYLGNPVFGTNNRIHSNGNSQKSCKEGIMKLIIKDLSLLPGAYSVSIFLGDSISDYVSYSDALSFEIQNPNIDTTQIPDIKHIGSFYLKDVTWILDTI